MMYRGTFLTLFYLIVASACYAGLGERTALQEERLMATTEAPFSHADFDRFLRRNVDAAGRIDYARVLEDRADLDRYRAALAETSPDQDPDRFSTEAARLAYWLNAYNASAIGLVLDHYPISSVQDVRAPRLLRFLPKSAGFFLFRRVTLGQRRTTLYSLENRLIRRRFADPRVHFALNCAAASCPRLPAEAFLPERLEEQLARETDRFLSEPRNVRLDSEARVLFLSSIFKWYEDDFVRWLKHNAPGTEHSLRAYLAHQLPAHETEAIHSCADCRVEFIPYDWSLNDRGAP